MIDDVSASNDLRAIADVASPNGDVSTSAADVSASSADIVASNEEYFMMFHNVLHVLLDVLLFLTMFYVV